MTDLFLFLHRYLFLLGKIYYNEIYLDFYILQNEKDKMAYCFKKEFLFHL